MNVPERGDGMAGVYEAYARRVGWSDLRRRLQDRLTMAREVLDKEGLGHVAALVPIEEVLIWMGEIEEAMDAAIAASPEASP